MRQLYAKVRMVLWICTLILPIVAMLPVCAPAFQNEPEDFRGIKWGAAAGELPDLTALAQEGDLSFYVMKGDKMQLGDAELENIVYGFYKDRFFNVMIYFSKLPNFLKVKEICIQHYGSGHKPNQYMDKYYWNGDMVHVFLEYDDISESGRLVYFYKPIEDELSTDEKTAAGKGSADL